MERKRSSSRDQQMMTEMKKGPWTEEEDEILKNYVKNYGPTGWSSIRSMGLLPRTGKSCRLRWVNKLRPNLKTGCKFSEEEERIVIELQAEFGNKWAKIATFLEGRTDNDVKNFWSARRKRLRRTPRSPTAVPNQRDNDKLVHYTTKLPTSHPLEAITSSAVPVKEPGTSDETNLNQHSQSVCCLQNPEEWKMVALQDFAAMGGPDMPVTAMIQSSSFDCSFSQQPQPQLDLPLLLPSEPPTPPYILQVKPEPLTTAPAPLGFELQGGFGFMKDEVFQSPAPTDSFLDDLPADIFDFFDSLPSSSELPKV